VLGAEHPDTLTSASNLASYLASQGKYADAERIEREVLGVRKRVLGAEHPSTLASANNLAASLEGQGKYAEAERIWREVLGVLKRVLGAEHPDTLRSASSLAMSLSGQGQHAEAERMLHATLASLQRVLGPAHPSTLHIAGNLQRVQAHTGINPPTNTAAPAATFVAQPLLAGTPVARASARRQARAQRQARARAVGRRAHRPICRRAGRREGAVAQGRVRGSGRVCLGGMRVGGGEQRVLSMPSGAVLLARVPARGLEGAQASVRGGTAVSVGES
jgi:hypothetical protein